MILYQFDNSFEGILTALFDAYSRKRFPDRLLGSQEMPPLFYEELYCVHTDMEKAERVWKAIQKKLSRTAVNWVIKCWLSEEEGTGDLLFHFLHKVVAASRSIETNFTDPHVAAVMQLGKKVGGEQLRVMQFMRFQKTADGIYWGAMEPIYNVLPLTVIHFRDRFSDQPWIIYDNRRQYGYYYNLKEIDEITFSSPSAPLLQAHRLDEEWLDKDEKLFQELWKSYFNSICIRERLNPVKHKKDMPVRYWKYLTEKQD